MNTGRMEPQRPKVLKSKAISDLTLIGAARPTVDIVPRQPAQRRQG